MTILPQNGVNIFINFAKWGEVCLTRKLENFHEIEQYVLFYLREATFGIKPKRSEVLIDVCYTNT